MKTISTILLSLLITALQATNIGGTWFALHSGEAINIEQERSSIRVYGLPGSNSGSYFWKRGQTNYDGPGRSYIFVVSASEIVYHQGSNRDQITFIRERANSCPPNCDHSTCVNRQPPHICNDHCNNHGCNFQPPTCGSGWQQGWQHDRPHRWNNRDNNRYNQRHRTYERYNSPYANWSVEGRWRSNLFREELRIKQKRDYLEVRFAGGKCFDYFPVPGRPHCYRDDRGNHITLAGDGSLLWEDGRRYAIRFYRDR